MVPTSDRGDASDTKAEDTPRRDEVAEIRQDAMRRRRSVDKRGSITGAAESPLEDDTLSELHSATKDADPETRLLAVEALGDAGDASSSEALRQSVQEGWREMKIAAIQSLGHIGGPKSLAILSDVLTEEADRSVRFAALTELEELIGKSATSGPDRLLGSNAIRMEVAEAFDKSPESMNRLIEALEGIIADHDVEGLLRMKAGLVRDMVQRPER